MRDDIGLRDSRTSRVLTRCVPSPTVLTRMGDLIVEVGVSDLAALGEEEVAVSGVELFAAVVRPSYVAFKASASWRKVDAR